jgi:all-trans-retinol 13,14-reductase
VTMLSPRTPISNLLLTGQNLMLHGLEGVSMTALLTCSEVLGPSKMKAILNH